MFRCEVVEVDLDVIVEEVQQSVRSVAARLQQVGLQPSRRLQNRERMRRQLVLNGRTGSPARMSGPYA